MARKYARDSHGRFSSTGATARGGRLATASGKRRATQTMSVRISPGSAPQGTVAKTAGGRARQKISFGTGGTVVKRSNVAERKAKLVKETSAAALSGKKVSPARRNYVKAQQSEKLRLAGGGKGNKARRRMAR